MTAQELALREWVKDRLGWSGLRAALGQHRAPRRGFVFYLGGITLFLFLVQVGSGILLLLHYRPDVTQAHASVVRIMGEIPYGDLIRGVHTWASDLFVACLVAHFFTVVLRGTFRPPHELTWLSGHAALVLGVGLAFTGAILPWSEAAYTHARTGSEIARFVPVVGDSLFRFMRGGTEVGPSTLQHAFGFHVAALPAAVTLMVAAHVFLLWQKPAFTRDEPRAERETMPLYPDFIVRQAVAWIGTLVLLMTLAIFVDRPLGVAADARLPSVGTRPPWYFAPMHEVIRLAPRELLGIDGPRFLVGAACLVGMVVVALPLIDPRGSKLTARIAWGVLLALLILGARAFV
jgi:quinol-cytochrome oxidoreductase complex cytochrome b subunit